MYVFVNWVMQKKLRIKKNFWIYLKLRFFLYCEKIIIFVFKIFSFLNLILNYTKKERLKVKILFFWQILFIIDIKNRKLYISVYINYIFFDWGKVKYKILSYIFHFQSFEK